MQVWSQGEGRWQPGDDPNARLRWFDLTAADGDALAELGGRFELHPLALEDCRSTLLHAPKLDDFGGYLFIILQGVQGTETTELDVFLGPDFLITYRDWEPSPPPESTTVAEALKSGQAVRPGVDGLFFEIADRLVDSVPPQLHVLGEQLDEIEGLVLSRQRAEQQAKILELRAAAGRIRRLLTPQLAVLQRLGRDDFKEVQQVNRMYFRDIYDHMVRIDLELEGIREDAEVALSTFLTAFNNRISDVMRVLTVVGALALPASVIASIFGTNFENVPLLHERWGFAAMIGSMLAVALMMAMYFKRKGWF